MLGGKRESMPCAAPAGGDHRLALVDVLGRVDEVEDQVAGVADRRAGSRPATPIGTTLAETALEWSAISVTWAEPPVTAVTVPTRPSPLTTGSLTLDAVAAADVDRDVGEPDGRRARDHPPRHRLVAGRDRSAAVEFEQLAQLRVFGQRRLGADRLFAGGFQFGCAGGCCRRGRRRSRRTS